MLIYSSQSALDVVRHEAHSTISREGLADTSVPRNILHSRILCCDNHLLWKNTLDLNSIDAWHIALQSLMPCNPTPACVADSEEPVKDLGGALGDLVWVACQFEEGLAVGAALLYELCVRSDYAADHASAHVTLLRIWNKGCHVVLIGIGDVDNVRRACSTLRDFKGGCANEKRAPRALGTWMGLVGAGAGGVGGD